MDRQIKKAIYAHIVPLSHVLEPLIRLEMSAKSQEEKDTILWILETVKGSIHGLQTLADN
jgi:hypothetical protein